MAARKVSEKSTATGVAWQHGRIPSLSHGVATHEPVPLRYEAKAHEFRAVVTIGRLRQDAVPEGTLEQQAAALGLTLASLATGTGVMDRRVEPADNDNRLVQPHPLLDAELANVESYRDTTNPEIILLTKDERITGVVRVIFHRYEGAIPPRRIIEERRQVLRTLRTVGSSST